MLTNANLVAAVERYDLDALDDLKATNEIITSSLNNDLQLVQSRHKNLITDYDQQRAHLVEALLDRETLRKELEVATKKRPTLDPESVDDDHKTNKEFQALKEVSHETESPKEKQPKRSFWRRVVSPISPRPKTPHAPKPEPSIPHGTSGEQSHGAVELGHERQAIDTLQRVEGPGLSLPRPYQPSPVRNVRTDVYRSQGNPKAETDIPRSNPKSKK